MKTLPSVIRLFIAALGLALAPFCLASAPQGGTDLPHATYVIVHGATGGGWDWKGVDRILAADGNTVYRPTLTGLGERVHLAGPQVGLGTHIEDIVNVILFEDLKDVVLVGHSYGGMVITGVMDRIPERIRHAVFLDAAAPGDGQSAFEYWHEDPSHFRVVNGLIIFPWLDATKPFPRDVPQPLKTFTEPVSYKNPAARLIQTTYVWFNHPDYTDTDREKAKATGQRLHLQRGWTIRSLDSDHVAERTHPRELAKLLEEALADRNSPAHGP